MNSYERLMKCFKGETPDRVPVVPIVREWCCKQANIKFSDTLKNVEKHVYSQYYCAKKFKYDIVWGLAGDYAESEAMGSKLKYADCVMPTVEEYAIKQYEQDLPRMKVLNPFKDGRLPLVLEGISRLKELCAEEIPVMAYMQAPLRHSAMLRGTENLMGDIFKREENAKRLLERATDSLIIWGIALVSAGADILFVSDPTSSGNAMSSQVYEEWGLPYTQLLVNTIKKTGVKTIMHVCGDTSDRLEMLATSGVDALSLDAKVDFSFARETLGPDYLLMGNIDPQDPLTAGNAKTVYESSKKVIEQAGLNGHLLLSSGCVVPEQAAVENMSAIFRAAQETIY